MSIPAKIMILLVRGYQYAISPMLGPHCRFIPSCSTYAIDAIRRFGLMKGCYLATRRLLRCHPWSQGGLDPVPQHRCSSAHHHCNSPSHPDS